MNCNEKISAVLTIAGSDSSGGAGIQADLRTFNTFKVYGCSVITAVTAQNPNEVRRVDILPVESIKEQLETVLDAIPINFAKTGMLANHKIIECVAEIASARSLSLVVDPVMVSTSGARLLEKSAISAMKEILFPVAKWITPNIFEAELICDGKINSFDDFIETAKLLYERYKCNVILKSGHLTNTESATDIVCYEGKLFELSSPKLLITGNSSHGTGCTLSAALSANFSMGKSWEQSLINAKAFVLGSLMEKVMLQNNLYQMYPPEKSYCEQVSLKKL